MMIIITIIINIIVVLLGRSPDLASTAIRAEQMWAQQKRYESQHLTQAPKVMHT